MSSRLIMGNTGDGGRGWMEREWSNIKPIRLKIIVYSRSGVQF